MEVRRKRWWPVGTAPARCGHVLTIASGDAACYGGACGGDVAHLGFRVQVGVGHGKLASDKVLGFRESVIPQVSTTPGDATPLSQ
jgi:hypothetical protein